jgi:YVTN family beta-propeller protein
VIEDVGIEPEGVNFSPDGKLVFITSEGTNTVIIIDPIKGKIIEEILVGNRPRRGAFTKNGEGSCGCTHCFIC